MMEAKDKDRIAGLLFKRKCEDLTFAEIMRLDEAIEISCKVGYNKAMAQLAGMTEECKQIGRQEVVEWTAREYGVEWEEEQLKEWGI